MKKVGWGSGSSDRTPVPVQTPVLKQTKKKLKKAEEYNNLF
jgi:hypothetical protein